MKGGKYENQPGSVWARYVPLAQKMQKSRLFMPIKTTDKNFVRSEIKEVGKPLVRVSGGAGKSQGEGMNLSQQVTILPRIFYVIV